MDKGLFFITLCMCCVWVIIDSIVGKDRIGALLTQLFPSLYGGGKNE